MGRLLTGDLRGGRGGVDSMICCRFCLLRALWSRRCVHGCCSCCWISFGEGERRGGGEEERRGEKKERITFQLAFEFIDT